MDEGSIDEWMWGAVVRDRDEAPLSELAERVDERRATDASERLFERIGPEEREVAPEEVWESLRDDAAPDIGATDGPDNVVDKRTYCQRCPHFSAPPEVACGHAGTEIVAVLEGEDFRVRNCPMVEAGGPQTFDQQADGHEPEPDVDGLL